MFGLFCSDRFRFLSVCLRWWGRSTYIKVGACFCCFVMSSCPEMGRPKDARWEGCHGNGNVIMKLTLATAFVTIRPWIFFFFLYGEFELGKGSIDIDKILRRRDLSNHHIILILFFRYLLNWNSAHNQPGRGIVPSCWRLSPFYFIIICSPFVASSLLVPSKKIFAR